MNCIQRLEAEPSSGGFLNKTVFLYISRFLDAVNAFSMLHMLRNLILMIFLCLQNNFILSRSREKIFNVNGQNFTCGSSEYFLGRQYFRAECKLFHLRLDTKLLNQVSENMRHARGVCYV